MRKQNYSAPVLEQVRMEAETPVMQTSGGPVSRGVSATLSAIDNW